MATVEKGVQGERGPSVDLEKAVRERTAELERANQQLRDEIAERKKVEAELRRNEEWLNESQRLSHTASWMSEIPSVAPRLMSAEMFRLMGLDPADPIPRSTWGWDVVHPDDRERVRQVITASILEKTDYEIEHRILRPDGSIRTIAVVGHPVLGESGRVTHVIGTSMDVTEKRAAEAELRKSEQRYRHIFESVPVAIIEHDFTGIMAVLDEIRARESDVPRYLDEHPEVASETLELVRVTGFNRAATKLLAIGGPDWDWDNLPPIAPEFRVTWPLQLRAIAEGKRIVEAELVLTPRKNETISTLETIVLPDPSSGYERVLCTFLDLTERTRAHEALQQAQASLAHATRVSTLGELTASIAHEVNQPLAAILNNANACMSLLSTGAPAEIEEARAALADIAGDADRASAVIERVRALARRSPPERERLQLADVLADVVVLAGRELASRRVAIRRSSLAPLPVVLGDRVQLQQVLLNLIVNGMDAMVDLDEGDRLLEIIEFLETLDGEPAAAIRVRDRGVGLSSTEMDRLFEAFYTTKTNGMGMGLAISRSIIEAHGGRMWAEPNNGPGATFAFALPSAESGVVVTSTSGS